ncbi:MAG: hypothetical protein ACYCZF_16580 [Anaerolineae bacterium]
MQTYPISFTANYRTTIEALDPFFIGGYGIFLRAEFLQNISCIALSLTE